MSPHVSTQDLQTLAADNTTFAWTLYQAIAADNKSSNLLYSPYSMSHAMAMTYAGAAGATAQQMAAALDFSASACDTASGL